MKPTRIAVAALIAGGLAVGMASPAQAAVPREYKDALATAQSYIDTLDFSKKGLYDQLVSNYGGQFPKKAAKYALKHVRVNYSKEALSAAKSYRDALHLSRTAIHDQLTSAYGGQFTESQADYALAHLPR